MNNVEVLIVVPACNEEASIAQTVQSIRASIRSTFGDESKAFIVVVCDSCTDETARGAQRALMDGNGLVVPVNFRNVGMTRDYGVRAGLKYHPNATWISFTDADSLVEADWIQFQLRAMEECYDAYFGRVGFEQDSDLLREFAYRYETQTHKRIHGANMGLKASAYFTVGGIPPIPAHEDKVLVERLESENLKVMWDDRSAVKTSVRIDGRAPEGFAATLSRFVQSHVLAI